MSDSASNVTLAFLIDAPLQAWGVDSRFQYRQTEPHPTKSALLGMLAAAMGIDKFAGDERNRLEPLNALRLSLYRAPRPGDPDVLRLSDYHTIGGGYDKRASTIEKMSIPRKASGPPFGTVITHRTYLTDARFVAAFTGDPSTVEAASASLADPVWGVWFGRKTCMPALPLSPAVGDTPEEAVGSVLERLAAWDETDAPDPDDLERWDEPDATDCEDGDFFLQDAPLSFGAREFTARPVRHTRSRRRDDHQ